MTSSEKVSGFPLELRAKRDPSISTSDSPRIAILFWFYDYLDVCLNRIELLRALNPGIAVFGLYGGDLEREEEFKHRLSPLLDDFYSFPEVAAPSWKWEHGDKLISRWYADVGHRFEWDTVVVVQWDILILRPLKRLLRNLRAHEIFLNSVEEIGSNTDTWFWTSSRNPHLHRRFKSFKDRLQLSAGYEGPLYKCLFILPCLPRSFLESYSRLKDDEDGFVEYRVPSWAACLQVPFADLRELNAWYPERPGDFVGRRRFLIPIKILIPLVAVIVERLIPWGARSFHPYHDVFHLGFGAGIGELIVSPRKNWRLAEIFYRKYWHALRLRWLRMSGNRFQ